MLTALLSLIAKELRQTFRDRRVAALLIIAPVMQLFVLGFAVNLEVEHVPTLVADEDGTAESRAFAAGLLAGDAFDPVAGPAAPDAAVRERGFLARFLAGAWLPPLREPATGTAAMEHVAHGDATVALVIPRGFGRSLAEGRPTTVQVLVDGGDSNRAIVAQNAVAAYALRRSLALAGERLAGLAGTLGVAVAPPSLRVEPRVLYNPTLSSQVYFVPGVAATLLLIVTLIVTAMGLAREKEAGTLEQVLVTPIGPTTLLLGKTIPYALFGLIDLGLVLGVGSWVFGVPLRGSLVTVFFAGGLYLLTTLGVGLLISAVAKTQQQSFMAAFFCIMPAILLSGFMTPIENMPTWLQPVTAFNPVRHFVEILRAVLLKGATVADLAAPFTALAAIGVTLFLSATLALRRTLR